MNLKDKIMSLEVNQDFGGVPVAQVMQYKLGFKHARQEAAALAVGQDVLLHELYEALETVVSNIERIEYGHYSLDGHEDLNPDEWLGAAKEALAKARGEDQ